MITAETIRNLAIALIVISILTFIFTNVGLRKRIFNPNHIKVTTKAGSKIGKDLFKIGKSSVTKVKFLPSQLPGGISNSKKPVAVTTAATIPKPGGIIPITVNSDPTYGIGNLVIKYLDGCNGYTLFETGPNGESLAFECVAGYDDKADKYTVWFYKVKYHKDSRKQTKEYRLSNEGALERSY